MDGLGLVGEGRLVVEERFDLHAGDRSIEDMTSAVSQAVNWIPQQGAP